MNTSDTQNTDITSRPFGFWITAVDRLMAAEFASAFESEQASRRDWRILNVIDGSAPARRPLNAHKLHDLVERGWVVADGDGWTLTADGRAAKERLRGIVDGIRAKVTDAVSPDDLDTTLATLEQIARAFGWDEETPLPRGRGRRRGFEPRRFGRGHGFGPAFGRRHGRPFGPGRDFGSDFGQGREYGHEHGADDEFGADSDSAGRTCAHHGHRGHDRLADERGGHGHGGHGHGDH
uniref:MarR family winged helix-turn-helix transcriptional regulator n=1 Tax=Microbacterium foliorum TaxID=104336 RepID=UPI0028D5D121